MFDEIAVNYDKLNSILTFNIDKIWRRKLANVVVKISPQNILDIAAGTGVLTLELLKKTSSNITAIDISPKMIEICKQKLSIYNYSDRYNCLVADVHNLPFQNSSFEVATLSFGIRNFLDLKSSLNEINRVLTTDGKLIVMEFFKSEVIFKNLFFKFYLKIVLPLLGRLVSGHKWAYKYLPSSIYNFIKLKEFENLLHDSGFKVIKTKKLFLGLVSLVVAQKID